MPNLEERLEALESDRETGAVGLAVEAVRIATDWIEAGRDRGVLAARLRSMHPAIAAVANVGDAVERGKDLELLRTSLEEGNARIAERLSKRIAPDRTIVTVSNSSTVRDALLTTLRPRLVLALASEPGGEGAALAAALELAGVTVRVEPDAAMGRLVAGEADLALVGADSFDETGNLVHKVGTLPLALCCRRFGKPFFAAGHTIKRVTELKRQPEDVRFDVTSGDLITALVSEED